MVLRQKRKNTDVLIIDASKHFEKVGKNNKLRASDIKRIVDVIRSRESVEKFSRVVTRDEIRANDYNLNIPRYVDSSEAAEPWDILSIMTGGVPNAELDSLDEQWQAFPYLREMLYISDETPYSQARVDNVAETVENSDDVIAFKGTYISAFEDFVPYLKAELIDKLKSGEVTVTEEAITENIFARLQTITLIDRYDAYQILHDAWSGIAIDLEMIRTEGVDTTKRVDPHMVIKKKDGKEEEVQDGWMGHVIPFELVQNTILAEEAAAVREAEDTVTTLSGEIDEIISSLSEEEMQGDYLNDDNTAFAAAGLKTKVKEIQDDIDSPELRTLNGYIKLLDNKAKKPEKLAYIAKHTKADWTAIEGDAPYAKGKVNTRIKELKDAYTFPEDSFEWKMLRAFTLLDQIKQQKKLAKQLAHDLHMHTKTTIEELSDNNVLMLLEQKWITPLFVELTALPGKAVDAFIKRVNHLNDKYATTLVQLDEEIRATEASFCALLGDLTGDEYDMQVSQNCANYWVVSDMAEKKMKPVLRFKGFTDEWEQKKLLSIATMHARIGWQNLRKSEFLVSGDYYLITGTDFIDGEIDLANCHFVTKDRYDQDVNIQIESGSILITKDGTLGKVAFVKCLDKPATLNAGVFNVLVRDKKIIYGKYLFQYLKAPFLMNYVAQKATGGTIKHLNQNILVDFPVLHPVYDEQVLLGNCFEIIDNLISFYQQKYEKLVNVKKSMLKKMFPQNGSAYPEIRFSGFTAPWEQRKLSEVLTSYTDPVEIPHTGYERLGIRSHAKGTFHSYIPAGHELQTAKMHRVAADKFIVNITFGWEHAVAVTDDNDAGKLVSHRFPQFSLSDELDAKFLKYIILDERFRYHLWLASPGGAGRNRVLNLNEMLQYTIRIPSVTEQQKIAKTLISLDNLITLHQHKLEKLENLKKSMLQRMFV